MRKKLKFSYCTFTVSAALVEDVKERVPVDFSRLTQEAWDYKLHGNCYIGFLNSGVYEDKTFVCADCGKVEVWAAKRQKWWYEDMKGNHFSKAIRCRECRRKEKTRKNAANAPQADAKP